MPLPKDAESQECPGQFEVFDAFLARNQNRLSPELSPDPDTQFRFGGPVAVVIATQYHSLLEQVPLSQLCEEYNVRVGDTLTIQVIGLMPENVGQVIGGSVIHRVGENTYLSGPINSTQR